MLNDQPSVGRRVFDNCFEYAIAFPEFHGFTFFIVPYIRFIHKRVCMSPDDEINRFTLLGKLQITYFDFIVFITQV